MKKPRDFTARARAEADHPSPATHADLWEAGTGTNAVVQRNLTTALTGGSAAREVKLAALKPDPNQPRKTIDPASLEDLANSIRENGVLQPITVTWSEGQQCYIVLTGQRRYEAARLIGLYSIPAIIRPVDFDERQRLQQQLVENIQREGIPPIEEARAVHAMMESLELSTREAAKKLGKPQTYVAELRQVLRLGDQLLAKAQPLSKRTLIEISRAPASEYEALVAAALSSDHPFRAAERNRTNRTKSNVFQARYRVAGLQGSVTVTLPQASATRKEVVDLLARLVQQLMSEESDSEAA